MRQRSLVTIGVCFAWTSVVVAATLVYTQWIWRPPVAPGPDERIEEHLKRTLQQATDGGLLGAAALVVLGHGEIAVEQGFGVANPETRARVDPARTAFRVASVSKAVTAWGVLGLVEEGRLSLDAPVIDRLTRWRFPASGDRRSRVTPRQLLSHTAGLDDGLGYGGFPPGHRVQTLEESLNGAADSTVGGPRVVTVAHEPGTVMAYSGGGYTILQLVIEEIAQRPFAEHMQSAVLRPLGMTWASFDVDALAGGASALAASFDQSLRPQPVHRYTATAAASLHASARDLARFARAWVRPNAVLRPSTTAQMMHPQPATAGSWGLGVTLFAPNGAGGYVIGHDGGTPPAWGASVRLNPASGNGIVVLVSGGRFSVTSLADDWLYWETGQATAARRQALYDLAGPALFAAFIGMVAIVAWQLAQRRGTRR